MARGAANLTVDLHFSPVDALVGAGSRRPGNSSGRIDRHRGCALETVDEPGRERGRGYYTGGALRITARHGPDVLELGDGGFTGWTAQLMGDSKERCLISCLATERLVAVADRCGAG